MDAVGIRIKLQPAMNMVVAGTMHEVGRSATDINDSTELTPAMKTKDLI